MNCEHAQDMLLDMVYGELDEPAQADLRAHIASCPACRADLARLSLARKGLAAFSAGEGPSRKHSSPVVRRPAMGRILAAGAAIAASVLIAAAVWLMHQTTAPVQAANGPVEIVRTGVSLTIMSKPPWASDKTTEGDDGAAMWPSQNFLPIGPDDSSYYNLWAGLALVRDQRLIRNLPAGSSEVRLTDIPAGIKADSVRLRSLDDPRGLTIREQNYQYDLAGAAAVLHKYIDREIMVTYRKDDGAVGPASVTGKLMSFDDANLVISPKPATADGAAAPVVSIARERVSAIGFDKLPDGLLSKPTLLWRLDNAAAAQQQFEVAYMTSGLAWRADYALRIVPAAEPAAAPATTPASAPGAIPDIYDSASIVGYATVTNRCGVSFKDAELKLMAGDAKIIKPKPKMLGEEPDTTIDFSQERPTKNFSSKSFFEYHLYTLERPTDLRDRETKQIEMFSGENLRLKRTYIYNPEMNPTAARVVSELTNSRADGVGKPLPKGMVRLYAPDSEGISNYVSQARIDHTPVDEKVRLPWGYAFDLACKATKSKGWDDDRGAQKESWTYTVSNAKTYGVTVMVQVLVPEGATKAQTGGDQPWHIRQVGLIEIPLAVPAGKTATATFAYWWRDYYSSGGLKSPYDTQ